METNQEFTFTRKAPNKAINIDCIKIKTSENTKYNEDIGFKFKKVGENPHIPFIANTKLKEGIVKKNNRQPRTNKENNLQEIAALSKSKNNKSLKTKSVTVYKKNKDKEEMAIQNTNKNPVIAVQGTNNNKLDQSVLEFNVIKKRRTIQLDQDIDLTSNSILVEAPKGECMSEETIRMNLPVITEKIKSNEIHKIVISNNINDLIKECLIFLKDDSKYSREIVKHCNANYFSDMDYRKEIEMANGRIEQVKTEISKWRNIFETEVKANAITVPEIQVPEISIEVDTERILEEFEEKAKILQSMNEKLRYFFENAKEKAENLLKSVFGSMEEKNLDALFLLKAMSKLGR